VIYGYGKLYIFMKKFPLEPSQVTIHKCSIEDQRYQCTVQTF